NHVETVSPIQFRLRTRGEGRALHVHISAAVVDCDAERPGGFGEQIPQLRADRLSERDMRSNTFAKECVGYAPACTIVKLRRQQYIAGRIFFLQAAHRSHRDDPADVERAERIDVGPVIEFMWQDSMAAAVSRQEINLTPTHFAADEDVRWRPERGLDLVFGRTAHLFHLIQTAAADDPNSWRFIFHFRKSSGFIAKDREDGKRIISPWRGWLARVLFPPSHAEIFHQDIRLPDERTRLGAGGALARGARVRAGRARGGGRYRAFKYLQRARHGGPKGAWQNGNARSHGEREATCCVWFPWLHGSGARRIPARESAAC